MSFSALAYLLHLFNMSLSMVFTSILKYSNQIKQHDFFRRKKLYVLLKMISPSCYKYSPPFLKVRKHPGYYEMSERSCTVFKEVCKSHAIYGFLNQSVGLMAWSECWDVFDSGSHTGSACSAKSNYSDCSSGEINKEGGRLLGYCNSYVIPNVKGILTI